MGEPRPASLVTRRDDLDRGSDRPGAAPIEELKRFGHHNAHADQRDRGFARLGPAPAGLQLGVDSWPGRIAIASMQLDAVQAGRSTRPHQWADQHAAIAQRDRQMWHLAVAQRLQQRRPPVADLDHEVRLGIA